MGRNKELRKLIKAQEETAEAHRRKIAFERRKSMPDEGLIRTWEREIQAAEKRGVRLLRRLEREW